MSNPTPFPLPKLIKSTVIHDDFVKIQSDLLSLDDRQYTYYSLITRSPAVIILGITAEGMLVLNEEYRPPTGKVLLCCPGGYIDENEEPLDAGRREFLEETGYTADHFSVMGSAYPYPGISNQKIYYIYAQNARKKCEPKLDLNEVLRTCEISYQQLKEAIAAGREIDGNLCTALFYSELGSVQ